MSLLTSTSPAPLNSSLCPGAYLTDGIRLYRVVATLSDPWKGGRSAELENCRNLQTALYPPDALSAMKLSLVRAAP